MNKAYNAWLKTRPKRVQKLAKEFPMGTCVQFGGEMLHLLGWTENDSIILSPINPSEDYDGALDKKVYACASHLRKEAK